MSDAKILTERQNGRQTELDVLRILLTILVVLGHGTYYTIKTRFGGIYYEDLMLDAGIKDTIIHSFAARVTHWIYSFHMPAYFCLSGTIFSMELKRNKYESLRDLIRIKAPKLLFPMMIVWVIWNIPIKALCGYYSNIDYPVICSLLQIIFPNCVYLWFLEALFVVFLLDYILVLKIRSLNWQIFIVSVCQLIGLFTARYCADLAPLGNPFKYLLWFWLGGHISTIIDTYTGIWRTREKKVSIRALFCETAFFFIIYELGQTFPKGKWLLVEPIIHLIGIIWIWRVSSVIDNHLNSVQKSRMVAYCGFTFGVYLWSDPLNYFVLYFTYKVLGIGYFGTEMGAIAIYFMRVLGVTLIAILITYNLKKHNIKLLC